MTTQLIFTPRTQFDANQFNQAVEASDFFAEWNVVEGFFSFPEDDATMDALEMQLQELCDTNEISGRFECQ